MYVCIYIYICLYIYISLSLYIYIFILNFICIYDMLYNIYIYIYILINHADIKSGSNLAADFLRLNVKQVCLATGESNI